MIQFNSLVVHMGLEPFFLMLTDIHTIRSHHFLMEIVYTTEIRIIEIFDILRVKASKPTK